MSDMKPNRILDLDDMLECLISIDVDKGQRFRTLLETIGTEMATVIAEKLEIDSSEAVTEFGFGGTCASFFPAHEGQRIPAELEPFDTGGDWHNEDEGEG